MYKRQTRTWSTNRIRRFPHRQNWSSLYKKHWKQTVWKKKTFVSRLNISRRNSLVLPVKNGKISMVSWIFLMKPSRRQIWHGNRNFLMTSLFRNIRENHDGHIRISLKMFLPAMRSFLFRRRSETVQPAEHRWLIKLQQIDGRGYSSIHSIRGVLRPAFQMAVDDDLLRKNPFEFGRKKYYIRTPLVGRS